MPKMKTNRAAAKRFRKTASGILKRKRAYKNHILTKKSRKRKRVLRSSDYVADGDAKKINKLVPYI